MNEIIAMVYGFARAAWRRRWLAVAVAWVIALPAWVYVLSIPDRYEASATVFVDARTPLRPVLEGIAIQEDYDSQLSLVREALLSRPQLEAVAKSTKLDADVKNPAEKDELISGLQEQIGIVSAASGSGSGQSRDTVYTIKYQNEDREKSVQVVRTLLENFVQGTLNGNRTGAGEAQEFLLGQITVVEKRLQEAEERLAEFKKRNIGMIPGEQGDYFSRNSQEMTGLQQSETALAVAISRRAELQRQLANARLYMPGTGGSGTGAGGSPDITIRRQEAEKRLEDLLQRFTDKHPDVTALRATIEELKSRETKELAELQRGGTGTGAIRSLSVNPVYQEIQSKLNEVQVEIASHQGAAEQHRREIANLRQHVNQAPEIEQEYARLNRDYGVTKTQYEQMVTRKEQARVSDDAARTGIVRFDIIEPPRAGLDPVSPRRASMLLMVLVMAVGAGIGLAMLPQLLAPTFGDIASLERKFGVPVLGAVSAVRTEANLKSGSREIVKVAFAGGLLVVLAGVLVVSATVLHRQFV